MPVLGTLTDIASAIILAGATVETRMVSAVVDLSLAVGARKARRTAARVGALAGVEAGASVATGLVIGAVVEVLVAEQAAPAFVAQAFPGLLAGAVQAARVSLALVAEAPFPAAVTSALIGLRAVSMLFITAR